MKRTKTSLCSERQQQQRSSSSLIVKYLIVLIISFILCNHLINSVTGKIKYFDTNSLFEQNYVRSTTSTSASDDDDTDYSALFSDTSPQLSLFGIHKIISARFVFSKFNEFIYLPSKSNSTMVFYFLTVLKDGFVKIDCDGVINTKDSTISSTLVVGKYNLEEEKVVWAAKQEIQYFFGKPFAYVTEKDEIIVSCNIKDDQGIFSKMFFSVNGVSTKGPSFVKLNTAREVNIVMEGSIDRFLTAGKSNQTAEGFLVFGAKNLRKTNSIYDSKKEHLHLETSIMASFNADGSPKWNVKLVYGNIEFFEILSVKVVSLSNTTIPIVTCINYLGTGSLKTFDSTTDDFVTQPGAGFGNPNFRLFSKYFTAGVYSISATGVFSELFSLRAYPTGDSTSANILVKGFYYDKDKKIYILLIYMKGYLTFSKASRGGSNMEGNIIYTSTNRTGDYIVVKYTEGSTPACIPTSYIGDDPIVTQNYFINKRIAIESNTRSKLHLEVIETDSGTIKDSLAIDVQSEDPYGIQFELFYEKRRYLIVRGTTQNNGTILINNKFYVRASKGQSELVFVLYLNTHPESTKYDLQCDQQLKCRADANDKICQAHGICNMEQKCECDEFYMGEFCETYYRNTFIVVMATVGVILITLTGSVLTGIGMYAYRTITKRLNRLQSKVKAEQELEQKLLEFVGLNINETTFNFKSWLIPFEQLTIDREIASSSGRTIFQGSWKGTSVAIKKVRLEDSFDYHEDTKELNLDKTLEREAAILSRVRHPNILRFWGLAFTQTEQFLVTELFTLSLDQILDEAKKGDLYIPILCKLQILHDLACSMTYLHEFDPPILHRNLKPSNIMLSEDVRYGKILSAVKPKIADFGLSTHLREDNVLTMQIGNVLYSDPLIFKGERYSEKCDVYSFSMIMYEMFFETEPYKTSDKVGEIKENYNQFSVLPNKISEGYRPKIPFTKTLESIGDWMESNLELINERIIDPENLAKCIQSYSELMKKCWSGDQDERPSFRSIQGSIHQVIKAMEIK